MKHTMHDAKMEVVFKIDKVIKILLIKYEMKDNQNNGQTWFERCCKTSRNHN
jgi:hypothetical protein